MNKLKISNDNITLTSKDDKLSLSINNNSKFLGVQDLKIKVTDNTDLVIDCENFINKLDITIKILTGVHLNVYESKSDGEYKFQYKYYLEEDSFLNIEKIIDVSSINEMTIINLDGENAKVNYNLKTISKREEKYNYLVYHNACKTSSNIINNGVNILDGKLEFNVSSFVPNNIKKCEVNQDSRIINMTDNACIIKPNLFIDEEDVNANHSALIGTFSFEEVFYLMSRGINKKDADSLLTRGFLMKGINYYKEYLEGLINKYWR
ncbi:MAG: SufD family Fe-S cluster assembly protein [Bacilli bacterium]|nr:SufD family Fe-S cluster assembly protein [Bacilli bacterium]